MAHTTLNEPECPVPERLLAELYVVAPEHVARMVDAIQPDTRAALALYCYGRSHLRGLANSIAVACDRETLWDLGGRAGAALFELSRSGVIETPPAPPTQRRRPVTLSQGCDALSTSSWP